MTVYAQRESRYPTWPAARDLLPGDDDMFGQQPGQRTPMPHKPLRYDVLAFDAADIYTPVPNAESKTATSHTIKRNVSRDEALRIIDRMSKRNKRLVYTAESTSYVPSTRVEYK